MERIGVTISTRNRRPVLLESLRHWRAHMPPGAHLVVVDDASDEPVDVPGVTAVRHGHRRGVAMTKNRGIAELLDLGVEHLFLADDDVWPVIADWWRPYVESPEHHLSYQWPRDPIWRRLHDDGTHWSIAFPRGVLLYATRKVIDTVGGMDPAYGAFSGEHVEWSTRIHRAGLTSWPYADVCGSERIWHSRDKDRGNTTGSSFPLEERRRLAQMNGLLWDKQRPTFMPYREGEGVQDFQLGPRLSNTYEGVLDHVLALHPHGTAVEFGVGEGNSLRRIAARMPVVGFDSFAGLPTDWRDGFPAGTFACDRPTVANAAIVEGLFADTLPGFGWPEHVGLVHFDADLYSSTATALEHIGPRLEPGTYVVFDEFHGYHGCEDHEQRAWCEFAESTGIGWTVIGHGPEQWAIRIT